MKLFKWKSDKKPVFPNLIEKFFGKKITDITKPGETVSTVPSVNISDAKKAFEVDVAVPGIDKKDINIEVQDNCLVISCEKQYDNEEKTKTGCAGNMAILHFSVCLNYLRALILTKFRLI